MAGGPLPGLWTAARKVLVLSSLLLAATLANCQRTGAFGLSIASVDARQCDNRSLVSLCSGMSSGMSLALYTRPSTDSTSSSVLATCSFATSSLSAASLKTVNELGRVLYLPCGGRDMRITVCFLVTCCNSQASPGTHDELCIDLGRFSMPGDAGHSNVTLQSNQTRLDLVVYSSKQSLTNCTQPGSNCQEVSFLSTCMSACFSADATGGGGLSIGFIVALAVSSITLVGISLFCLCLFKFLRKTPRDDSAPYGIAKPLGAGDSSTAAANAGNGEIRALQDLTFGRMSPDWALAASRQQSILPDEDPDANAPIPPLNYKEVIESGWYEKWLVEKDYGNADSRNSVLSIANGCVLGPGHFTLHTNSVALGLNERESQDEPNSGRGSPYAHLGTSV